MNAEISEPQTIPSQPEDIVTPDAASTPAGRWLDGVWTPIVDMGVAARGTISDITLSPRVQYLIFGTIFIVALVARIFSLGNQAVHHDESLHGYYAWRTSIGEEYVHNPLTHGMFLFEIVAATFVIFGDSEFTLRLSMAIFGALLVLIPILLRKEMGTLGAIIASIMLTFSPALLYFSRFARNDIYMAAFALLLVAAMFRYIETRRAVWLYVAAATLALALSTKETAYIIIALFGIYLVYRSRTEIVEIVMGYRRWRDIGGSTQFLAMMAAISLPFAAPMISIFQDFIGITLAAREGVPNVATGAPDGTTAMTVAAIFTLLLLGVGVLIGALTLGRRFWISLAVFWIVYGLIMTNLGNSYSGIVTGVWQSLGYWIAQQDVRRGNQPWYYYFIMVSIYEFLPVLFSLGIALFYAVRSGARSIGLLFVSVLAFFISTTLFFSLYYQTGSDPPSALFIAPFLIIGFATLLWMPFTFDTSQFTKFLIFWSFATFSAYSLAGEKMPWLLVNVTLPFVMLAAKGIAHLILHIDWRAVIRRGGWLAFPLMPIFIVALWRLMLFDFGPNFDLTDPSDLGSFFELWMLIAFLGFVLLLLYQYGSAMGFRQGFAVVAISLATLLFAFTIKSSIAAAYIHRDTPMEMLIYTQTAPDLHQTAHEIRQANLLVWDKKIHELSTDVPAPEEGEVENPGLSIAIDTKEGFAWPWNWYLRGFDTVSYITLEEEGASVSKNRTVAVVNDGNLENVRDSLPEHLGEGRYMIHRWWFPESYRRVTPGKVWNAISNRSEWHKTVDYWLYRRLPTPIGYVGSYVYFSDYLPRAPLR